MLKKTITYTDYNGIERTEDFYFNLTKAELMEMELTVEGGFADMVEKIVASNDTPSAVKIFKKIILASYGEKSPDGRRFIKSKEISDSFVQTEAYSELFTELARNDEEAAAFINGVIPQQITQPQLSPASIK